MVTYSRAGKLLIGASRQAPIIGFDFVFAISSANRVLAERVGPAHSTMRVFSAASASSPRTTTAIPFS